MPRDSRRLSSKDALKSRVLEVTYTPDKVILQISRESIFGSSPPHTIQFILWPDDVRELLEMIVWADSSREVAHEARKGIIS